MWKANLIFSYTPVAGGPRATQQYMTMALTQKDCADKVQEQVELFRKQIHHNIVPTIITTFEEEKTPLRDKIVKGQLFVGIISSQFDLYVYISSYYPVKADEWSSNVLMIPCPNHFHGNITGFRDAVRDILEMGGATVIVKV